MTLRAALTDALLTTIAAPATWPMALATFLLRGGVFVVVLPIVALPSPVGLANLLAPTLMAVAFRGITPDIAILVVVLVGAFVAWLVVGGLVGSALEVMAASIVLRHDVRRALPETDALAPLGTLTPARVLAARLIAHVPTVIGLIWAMARLIAAAYRELTGPVDVATPIVLRVVRAAPEAVIVLFLSWVVGEVLGALAARRIVAADEGVWQALRSAALTLVRHPFGVFGAFLVPLGSLVLVLVVAGMAASASWTAVQAAMQRPGDTLLATVLVVTFVSLWVVGLVLVAAISAWRGAVWTLLAPTLGSPRSRARVASPGREAGAR